MYFRPSVLSSRLSKTIEITFFEVESSSIVKEMMFELYNLIKIAASKKSRIA